MKNGHSMSIKLVPLEILKAYKGEVLKHIDRNGRLDVDSVSDLSVKLFSDVQVKGIKYNGNESDMLLFQYGTYNWGDKKGNHANFDITRQFKNARSSEFYQLSFSLIFDPIVLDKADVYNTWSADYASINDWIDKIKDSTGYIKMKQADFRTYEIDLQKT